jgi:hypothetical protein
VGELEAEALGDRAHLARLVAEHERDGDAVAARAARAARAVHVAVLVLGGVEVDDVADVGDVDAAGGDVGRDQHVDVPALERGQRALALVLVLLPWIAIDSTPRARRRLTRRSAPRLVRTKTSARSRLPSSCSTSVSSLASWRP